MFITNSNFRHPISDSFLTAPNENYWLAAELALHQSWFLVTIRQHELIAGKAVLERLRTVFLTNVTDIESLAQLDADALPQFESALIITPGRINGTGTWKMEPLIAVWVAEEPAAPGAIVEICETQSGTKYVTSNCVTPMANLKNQTLRYKFPVHVSK